MFRFAVAAGCAQLVAGARTQEINGDLSLDDIQNNQHDTLSAVENSNSTTYCPYASGFTAHEGKCTGQFVENWANGEYANYGQDSNGHIHGLADTAHRCRQHWDCSGFYTREGVGYSHWRTGRFAVNPNPGHCCYRKVGGGSNLLEVSASEDADAEGAIVATQDEAQPQRCDAGRTCPTYDHCHPVSYGAYGCGFQCTRQGGHGSYLCNNHCAGCNYVSLLELPPSLLESENVDVSNEEASGSLATHVETNRYHGQCTWEGPYHYEVTGHDLTRNGHMAFYPEISSHQCRDRCSEEYGCTAYVHIANADWLWNQHQQTQACYLKTGIDSYSDREEISHMRRRDWSTVYFKTGCPRSGHSLAELSAENEESKEEASGTLATHDEEEELSGSCSYESDTEYYGGDYDIIPETTQSECCRRCRSESHRCKVAIFFEGNCYLKDDGHGSSSRSSGRMAMRPYSRSEAYSAMAQSHRRRYDSYR